jgi:hypothetical protein
MSDHNANLAKEIWQKQNPLFVELYKTGAGEFFGKNDNLAKAFELKDRNVRCMDEGTPTGIHLAGSGILMGEEKAAAALKLADCDGVYSHAECGAAGIYAKANGLDAAKADEYGIEWSKKIAEKLGVEYKGHIGLDKMARPSGLHVARIAYYDGTGKFDFTSDEKMPPGFVVGRRYVDAAYALEEVKVAIAIATGGHGFGELITAEAPFMIVVIGDPANADFSVDKLKTELTEIEKANGGKVKVDGFMAP